MTPNRAAFIKSLYVPWKVLDDRLWYANDPTLDEWMNTVDKFGITPEPEDVAHEKHLYGKLIQRMGPDLESSKLMLNKLSQLLLDIQFNQGHHYATEAQRFEQYWLQTEAIEEILLPTRPNIEHPNETYLRSSIRIKQLYDAYMAENQSKDA